MSISTYDELKVAVAAWMHRNDLTTLVPDFIQMGEAVLNRKLRTIDMETSATASTGTVSRYVALPTGFLEMSTLRIQDPQTVLYYITPDVMNDNILSGSGTPEFFTITDQIELDTICSSDFTLDMLYVKKYDIAADSTNWLLTNHPELYLHASLSAASLYVVDDARLPTIKSLLAEGIDDVNLAESKKRGTNMALMRADDGLVSNHGFNIYKG